MEPCRFVTALGIYSHNPEFEYMDFYTKFKYLKFLTVYDSTEMIMNMPYFPSKLELQSEYPLSLLAEKTLNRPLLFLKIATRVQSTEIQQFLKVSYRDVIVYL
uniref:Uncharacterized protein n=1 Tax=Panagrolaimus sp. JU765 TaxID=591449 RepID=A0AC34Q6W6_9BILA